MDNKSGEESCEDFTVCTFSVYEISPTRKASRLIFLVAMTYYIASVGHCSTPIKSTSPPRGSVLCENNPRIKSSSEASPVQDMSILSSDHSSSNTHGLCMTWAAGVCRTLLV